MKEKDQCNRKYEQEMESVTFRNQQLTKRVMVLQEESEISQRASKKGKVSSVLLSVPLVCSHLIMHKHGLCILSPCIQSSFRMQNDNFVFCFCLF